MSGALTLRAELKVVQVEIGRARYENHAAVTPAPDAELVRLERIAGRAASTLWLDAPASRNALDLSVVRAIRRALHTSASAGDEILFIASTGPVFCAGVGLAATQDDWSVAERFMAINDLLSAVRSQPLMTVALVDGTAIGAGADLALACDRVIGTARASFRFPGPRFGLCLGTPQLVARVGRARAFDLLVEQRQVNATESRQLGLLDELSDAAVDQAQMITLLDRWSPVPPQARLSILSMLRPQVDGGIEFTASLYPGIAPRLSAFARRRGQED